jgi:hypothetical protein
MKELAGVKGWLGWFVWTNGILGIIEVVVGIIDLIVAYSPAICFIIIVGGLYSSYICWSLLKKRKGIVKQTNTYIVIMSITNIFISIFVSPISPGYTLGSLIWAVIWFTYFNSSIRVKNTYTEDIEST